MVSVARAMQHKQLAQLLSAAITLCLLDGTLTKRELEKIVVDATQHARRNAARLRAKRRTPVDLDVLGHVVYQWQRSPKYLDTEGRPFPIPTHGPAPSVEALFRQLKVSSKFEASLPQLREYRRVRVTKGGLCYPTSETTIIPTLTPEVVVQLTQTINRLVATVLHNTSARGKSPLRLIERQAWVPDLPKEKLPEFKRFALEQAGGMIETVNDWLETRRGSAARRPNTPGRVEVGLHAFAFVEK